MYSNGAVGFERYPPKTSWLVNYVAVGRRVYTIDKIRQNLSI